MEGDEILQKIIRALRTLRFGTLEIVVHDSKVVRIERRERIRLDIDSEDSRDHPEISIP
ncbi:MAG TPA: DUF2292 domain-containing protein [Terriglobia bacterium]|nr:DUF2292 domain-containing protein [Terriglobia bacterium]